MVERAVVVLFGRVILFVEVFEVRDELQGRCFDHMSGSSATLDVSTTSPPRNVVRKLSLSSRIRASFSLVTTSIVSSSKELLLNYTALFFRPCGARRCALRGWNIFAVRVFLLNELRENQNY
jgi:hypothetical protein